MPTRTVVEVRPGEGGDDAVLFAEELTAAFAAHSRRVGDAVKVERGRTTVLTITGRSGSLLTPLAGTHRVQRIPRNDPRGRRHTSTATVAVLAGDGGPDLDVPDSDLDVEVFRGSGPGGQHRNKTATCARVTHVPTGLVVVATRSRSQHQNIEEAKAEVRTRLTAGAQAGAAADRRDQRNAQITTAERPVKAFTWNDQRGEVIDHATGRRYQMRAFLQGRF